MTSMRSHLQAPLLSLSYNEQIPSYYNFFSLDCFSLALEDMVSMDIISQLQDQVNKIAYLTFNTVGTLQRDAPPSRLAQQYPEPPPTDAAVTITQQPAAMAEELLRAAQEFDALVAALPVTEEGEEAQLKQIAKLQAENEEVGLELQRQLEAVDSELEQVRELFHAAADNFLRLKPPQ